MQEEHLEDIKNRVNEWKNQGGVLDPLLIEFIDDLYVLASKLYMIVHKDEDN